MFRTTLLEIAGNNSPETGKKSGSKGNSNSMRNNFEFQKLLRDVEAEMNLMCMKVGGRGRSDAHPKMAKTLELVRIARSPATPALGRMIADAQLTSVASGPFHTSRR